VLLMIHQTKQGLGEVQGSDGDGDGDEAAD